jgi:hypothetical protein
MSGRMAAHSRSTCRVPVDVRCTSVLVFAEKSAHAIANTGARTFAMPFRRSEGEHSRPATSEWHASERALRQQVAPTVPRRPTTGDLGRPRNPASAERHVMRPPTIARDLDPLCSNCICCSHSRHVPVALAHAVMDKNRRAPVQDAVAGRLRPSTVHARRSGTPRFRHAASTQVRRREELIRLPGLRATCAASGHGSPKAARMRVSSVRLTTVVRSRAFPLWIRLTSN